jgi:Na+/H+ antiporter NhaD/arsenite permease-like protein
MNLLTISVYVVIVLAFIGIAIGRLPRLAMNRASIALAAALILVLLGGISHDEAFAAIDVETLALLLAMMLIVANLRISGFFGLAGSRLLSMAGNPRSFLALVIVSSGFLSALFLNDTICLMLTPLVIEIVRRKKFDGRPYLIALAVSANAGSCATPIGNPQNMLIASQSGLRFFDFVLLLGPPSLFALGLCYAACLITFHQDFSTHRIARPELDSRSAINNPGPTPEAQDRKLMIKSLVAATVLLVLLATGLRTSVAALSASTVLLVSRRIKPERVFAHVDFELLVFFSGLFVAGQAEREGMRIGFMDYLKLGLPVTLASVAAGSLWLQALGN